MAIQLNPEQERVVGQAMRAGLIRDLDDVVDLGIAAIRQRLEAQPGREDSEDAEAWSRRLAAWSESHSMATPLLPDQALDRDSIYGERGL